MADDQGEKTEEPTEHKLAEARKKGQIFKSTEIVSSLQFAAMMLVLSWTGGWAMRSFGAFVSDHVWGKISMLPPLTTTDVWIIFMGAIGAMAKLLLPVLLTAVIAAIILNMLQTGVIFSAQPMTPSFEKISPIAGFKRIFSRKSLMEFFKQMFKITVIGAVTYKIVRNEINTIVSTVAWDLPSIIHFTTSLMFRVIWYVTAAYMVLAVVDYLVQRKFFMKDMRMSLQELKDEFKDTEGDPQVKARMRQMQRAAIEQSIRQNVPKASAVVTNPTHLAVALQYEQGKQEAPIVIAKGERLLAQQIKDIAEEYDIPIVENTGLARTLFENCRVGEMIPGDLYKATAEVLAFVYRLKKKKELAKKYALLKIRTYANNPARHKKTGGVVRGS